MTYPKITYTPVAGGAVQTLNFQRPPRFVAAYNRSATRHDNLSTAGVKEVVVERIDSFLELTLEWAAKGADVDAWDSFMQNALQGVELNYFPEAALPAYTTYTLEDTDWKAEYKSLAQYTFKALFRAVVT